MSFAEQGDQPSHSQRANNRLAICLAVVALLLALFFSYIEIIDFDLWMHLASGRLIVSEKRIPAQYPFASTTDAAWYYHEWLAAVVLYAVERVGEARSSIGGLAGIGLLRIALALATLYVLYRILARRLPVWERFVILVLALLLMKERWIDRPFLFTTFLFALYLYYLLPPARLRLRNVATLSLLMIVWANVHGGFLFGIVLVGICFIDDALRWMAGVLRAQDSETAVPEIPERARNVTLLLAFAFLATLVNPYFVNVYRVPAQLASYKLYHVNIYEWFPPTLTIRYAHYWFMLFLTVGVCVVTVRRLTLSLVLLVALAGYLSVRYVRFFDLAALVFAAVLAQQWGHLRGVREKRSSRRAASSRRRTRLYLVARAVLTAVVVYLVALHVWAFPYKHSLSVRERSLPERAVQFIREYRLPQNLFNMYHWGGYLEWTLFPQYRVFIDGRGEVFGEALFEEYGNAMMGKPGWEATLDRYRVETALLSYPQFHPFLRSETRLQEMLSESPNWALVYWDDTALVFVRRTEANREIIERHGERIVNPLRYDWIRGLAADKEKLRGAIDALNRKISDDPDCSVVRVLLSQVELERGQRREAQEQLKLALERNPRSNPALGCLIVLALQERNASEAFHYLRLRARIGAPDKLYYNYKGAAYLLVQKYRAALRCFNKALALDPAFAEAQKNKMRTLAVIEQQKARR